MFFNNRLTKGWGGFWLFFWYLKTWWCCWLLFLAFWGGSLLEVVLRGLGFAMILKTRGFDLGLHFGTCHPAPQETPTKHWTPPTTGRGHHFHREPLRPLLQLRARRAHRSLPEVDRGGEVVAGWMLEESSFWYLTKNVFQQKLWKTRKWRAKCKQHNVLFLYKSLLCESPQKKSVENLSGKLFPGRSPGSGKLSATHGLSLMRWLGADGLGGFFLGLEIPRLEWAFWWVHWK